MPRTRYMRGGEGENHEVIQNLNNIKDMATQTHSQIKQSLPEASRHDQTVSALEEFNSGINNLAQHAEEVHNQVVNLGSPEATEHSTYMVNNAKQSVSHAEQGNYTEALNSADRTKEYMSKAIGHASYHNIGQKQVSDATFRDHVTALTKKMPMPFSGGGYTRNNKQSSYRQRKHNRISSAHKYSNYFNRLHKPSIKKRKKRKKTKKK